MKLPEKLGIAGTSVSLMGIAFGWVVFPWLLKSQIGKIKGLAPGSESREFWERIPFPFEFKIYVFNLTNAEAVQNGEIPEVEEIGPYHYIEWKEKADVTDFEEDDSVTFYMKNTYYFDKEKTAPLTGEEVVTIPNPILVLIAMFKPYSSKVIVQGIWWNRKGTVYVAERDKPGVLGMINKALGLIFNKPESIFLKTTVNDLLFGGILLNCTTKDFSASAVCAVIKKESADLEIISPTVSKFSVFKMKNGTKDPNKFKVNRGIKEPNRVGEVLKLNEKKKLTTWRGTPCNNLDGTDATVFPPIAKPENDIVSFNYELCRSIGAKYIGPSKYKSISSLRYNVTFGDMSSDPSLRCFCYNETTCYKKGVMDMLKCMGAPIIASLPHFYDAHEDYIKGVKGLSPNEKNHSIVLEIEPNTGTPLQARKRIQFSFPIHKVNKIDITQNLPNTLLPFIWVEESVDLPDKFLEKLDNELFQIIRIVDVVKWLLTILGAAIMSGGVGLYYKRQNSLPITPTSSASRKFGSNDYLADKKNSGTELGHTNLGYI